MEKVICEYCGTECSPGMYKRWHGDNCKSKPVELQTHVEEKIELPVSENWPHGSLLPKGEKKMSTFVEVVSADKDCQMIVNLDHVSDIIPLAAGGCILGLSDNGIRTEIKVKDDYGQFRQFAMQTVSAEDIERQVRAMVPDITRM